MHTNSCASQSRSRPQNRFRPRRALLMAVRASHRQGCSLGLQPNPGLPRNLSHATGFPFKVRTPPQGSKSREPRSDLSLGSVRIFPALLQLPRSGSLPFCVWAVLGDDHLELPQPAHGRSVGACRELQEQPLLLIRKRVDDLPELPGEKTHHCFGLARGQRGRCAPQLPPGGTCWACAASATPAKLGTAALQ